MSCSLTGREQPSIRTVFNTIESMYELEDYKRDVDLKRWANQGVLLINTALTCEIDNIGSHIKLWSPFISYLMDTLNYDNRGLIFVFLGAKAQAFSPIIGSQHYKIELPHPAAGGYTGKAWNHEDLFKQIDTILLANNGDTIVW